MIQTQKQKKAEYKVKPKLVERDLKDVMFKKRSKLEQAEHELAIALMENRQLKTHIGYMTIIAILCVAFGLILGIIAVIEN